MTQTIQLGDLQYAIMRILWENQEATASEVHKALFPERGLAPTTIATMLSKMEKKGVIDHRTEGRQYIYRPLVEEREVQRSMVAELLDRVFQGDAAALVNHLLREKDIDPDELQSLRALISKAGLEEEESNGK